TINFVCSLLVVGVLARARTPSSREAYLTPLTWVTVVALLSTLLVLSAAIFAFVKVSREVAAEMALLPGEFSEGIGQAMSSYGRDGSIKTRLDILQIDYKCCGDGGYTDWFSVPWVPDDVLVVDSKELQSCCDPASARPCIHHHVNTPHLHYNYDPRVAHTLHKQGCRHALMDFFGHTMLRNIGIFLLLLAFLQAGAVLACRLIQTSMVAAIKNGDITGPGQGKDDEEEGKALLEGDTTTTTDSESPLYDDIGSGLDTTTSEDEAIYENIDDLGPTGGQHNRNALRPAAVVGTYNL
ncbi:hypothetical protein BaRGS_00004434, partial [Batillaria attramentaria]